jgi:hypothetical protein
VLYLPDLTQKYGLKISGGAGELRATENLVNGWMHTGPGPIYIADSTTSQNVTASGQAVADVTQALGQIALSAAGIPSLPSASSSKTSGTETAAKNRPDPIKDYAQIFIFEPVLSTDVRGTKTVSWHLIDGLPKFPRDWIELERDAAPVAVSGMPPGAGNGQDAGTAAESAIRQTLSKSWKIADSALDVKISSGKMVVTIAAKPVQVGGNAAQLKSDTFDAAKNYDASAGLNIPQDPDHISVSASIDPTP